MRSTMKVEILVKVIKGDGVSGCGRFMPFWKIGNPSFTPLNQGPDRFVAGEHAMLDSLSEGCLAGLCLKGGYRKIFLFFHKSRWA